MIKINSISGVVRNVKDLDTTAAFYEAVGLRVGKREADYLTCYVNWFWVEFHVTDQPDQVAKEELAISVENIDEFYEALIAKNLQPQAAPQDQPWGRREFTLVDPDGYKLLFFKKK